MAKKEAENKIDRSMTSTETFHLSNYEARTAIIEYLQRELEKQGESYDWPKDKDGTYKFKCRSDAERMIRRRHYKTKSGRKVGEEEEKWIDIDKVSGGGVEVRLHVRNFRLAKEAEDKDDRYFDDEDVNEIDEDVNEDD